MRIENAEELPLETLIFELRYEHAYLVWDNFGSIWSAVLSRNPALRVTMVQATRQVFDTDDIQLSMDDSALRVATRGPEALDNLVKNAATLTRVFSERAKVTSFKRAGFR
ncbi:MAG TPA: hypothetical protein VMD29_15745, partial [Terracidiphilus sp.]|nr:hypothetical protein [Terracidiphilus sp.]